MTAPGAPGSRRVSHERKIFPHVSEEWKADAACRGQDPELWFPLWGDHETADKAKAICNECPVKYECGEYAYNTKTYDGIWGGQTERERNNARRRALRSGKGGDAIAR